MARGRVGPLGELRIVAAQIEGARRRQDDLEELRRRLICDAVAERLPIERIAVAARLDVDDVRELLAQVDDERPVS